MDTLLRFGETSLNISDGHIYQRDCTAEMFAVAHAFLVDTYESCTYHRQRWQRAGVKLEQIQSFADFRRLPMMGPEDVQSTPEFALLPDRYQAAYLTSKRLDMPLEERLWRRFNSTGSTGKPKASYYTRADWEVAMATSFRNFHHAADGGYSRLFNNFNVGHVAGKIVEDSHVNAGVYVENRHFLAVTEEAALQQLQNGGSDLGGLDAIAGSPCLPPGMTAKKGVTLDDLLKIDVDNYIGRKIRVVICGGFPSDYPEFRLRERVWEANELAGVERTVFLDVYGASEIFPTFASSCQHAEGLHVNHGNIYAEVIDETTGELAKNGGRGLVAYTALRHGSRFVRYVLGDEATYLTDPCPCGRRTPRLHNIRRVLDKERLRSGCAAGGIA